MKYWSFVISCHCITPMKAVQLIYGKYMPSIYFVFRLYCCNSFGKSVIPRCSTINRSLYNIILEWTLAKCADSYGFKMENKKCAFMVANLIWRRLKIYSMFIRWSVFAAQRYALALQYFGNSVCPSVRLSHIE